MGKNQVKDETFGALKFWRLRPKMFQIARVPGNCYHLVDFHCVISCML